MEENTRSFIKEKTVTNQIYKKYTSILLKSFVLIYGYRSTFVNDIKNQISLDIDISEKIKSHFWQKIPWRLVVEHTLSWINHSRHLSIFLYRKYYILYLIAFEYRSL